MWYSLVKCLIISDEGTSLKSFLSLVILLGLRLYTDNFSSCIEITNQKLAKKMQLPFPLSFLVECISFIISFFCHRFQPIPQNITFYQRRFQIFVTLLSNSVSPEAYVTKGSIITAMWHIPSDNATAVVNLVNGNEKVGNFVQNSVVECFSLKSKIPHSSAVTYLLGAAKVLDTAAVRSNISVNVSRVT